MSACSRFCGGRGGGRAARTRDGTGGGLHAEQLVAIVVLAVAAALSQFLAAFIAIAITLGLGFRLLLPRIREGGWLHRRLLLLRSHQKQQSQRREPRERAPRRDGHRKVYGHAAKRRHLLQPPPTHEIHSSDMAAALAIAWLLPAAWVAVAPGHLRHTPPTLVRRTQPLIAQLNATRLFEDAVRSVSGDENYQFGDWTKGKITELTGKDASDYKFGDITKKAFTNFTGKDADDCTCNSQTRAFAATWLNHRLRPTAHRPIRRPDENCACQD